MNKRLQIGLAPLLAIAAFAVMPMAAQAAPHIYVNGVKAAETKKVRFIAWSTLKFTNPSAFGETECHSVVGGLFENPTGGGAAMGKVQGLVPYECVNASCTTLGGKNILLTAEKFPWNFELTEPESGVFRNSMGKKGEKGGAGSIEFFVTCVGVAEAHFFGALAPKILNNGMSIGAVPGEMEFDEKAGELESTDGPGRFAGRAKIEGYAGQELLEVQNP
jgi:hypothetical protein